MTTPNCACSAYADTFDRARRQGVRYVGTNWTVTSVELLDVKPTIGLARIEYVVAPYRILDANGKVIERVKKRRTRDEYSFVKDGDRWVAARIFDTGAN